MVEVEKDVVLLWSNTSSLADFHCHGARHHITGRQIFGCGGISAMAEHAAKMKLCLSHQSRCYCVVPDVQDTSKDMHRLCLMNDGTLHTSRFMHLQGIAEKHGIYCATKSET